MRMSIWGGLWRFFGLWLISSPALAQVTVLNQLPASPSGNFWISELNCGGHAAATADNFTLAERFAIHGIVFDGAFYLGTPTSPTAFTVYFHADSGGLPGAVLARHDLVVAPVARPGGVVQRYESALPSPLVLNPGTYWMEVIETGNDPDNCFGWQRGVLDGVGGIPGAAQASGEAPGSSWTALTPSPGDDLSAALALTGIPAPSDARAVPSLSPVGWAMLVAMLAIAAATQFSRRKK